MTGVVLGIGACLATLSFLLRDRLANRHLRLSAEELLAEEGFGLMPESELKLRVARILPSVASEDVSAILMRPMAPDAPVEESPKRDDLPDSQTEWSIRISLGAPLPKSAILQAFKPEWRREYPGVVYGRSTGEHRWAFVDVPDSPEEYDSLVYAVELVSTATEPVEPRSESMLRHLLSAVKAAAAPLEPASIEADPAAAAAQRASKFFGLWQKFGREAIITLAAPDDEMFDGRDIWDVMLALGIEWGDGDLFHWRNDSEYGDSIFFSVWTTTDSGYFVPEEIAADRFAAEDLVFGYSIPRSAYPVAVFDQMLNAARYAQKRLGGNLVDHQGREFDETPMREEIAHISESLRAAGIPPGGDSALRLF